MTRPGERVGPSRRPELAVLMLLTGAGILACYLAVVLAVSTLLGAVGPVVSVGLAVCAALAVSLATTSIQLARVRRNAHRITPDSDPRLHATVERMSDDLGMAAPELYLVEATELNARAIGTRWDGAILFHSALYDRLDDDELDAIAGHELAHLYYCDSLVTVASIHVEWVVRQVAAAVAALVNLAVFAVVVLVAAVTRTRESPRQTRRRVRVHRLVGQVCVGAAGLVVFVPRNALSRYREFVADQTAAGLLGDPEPMIAALELLDERATASGGALDSVNAVETRLRVLYATHPSIHRRIAALRSDDRKPTGPTDPGPIFGTGTRLGLTVAPVVVLTGYTSLLAAAGGWLAWPTFAFVGTTGIGAGSLCWALLFGAGGDTRAGLLALGSTALLAVTVGSDGVTALSLAAATPLVAVAARQLLAAARVRGRSVEDE